PQVHALATRGRGWDRGGSGLPVAYVDESAAERLFRHKIDACEYIARVLANVPDPKRHLVHYYGAYSNAARGKRKKAGAGLQPA
ncbi:MAG: hypothetical protein JXO72_10065, partial [Vicinamibacteria bacterium]|nr:hypothetical protein [Vicinamibacteria bacterium]